MKKETFEDAIPKPNGLYFKLWKAKQEIGKVTKGKDNPFFKSKYADLNAILEATEPILLKYNLMVLQPIVDGNVCTRIYDCESGEYIESSLHLPVVTDPQKQIAGVTYFRRATLQSLLSLQAIDDDGNEIADTVKKQPKYFPQDRFEKGLSKVESGELTKDSFKAALVGFDLTDVQSKALLLL